MDFAIYVVYGFGRILILLIILQAIMSWFVPNMSASVLKFYGIITSLTEPILMPFRALTMRFIHTMGIDFSPILAIFAIQILQRIIISLLVNIH